MTVQYSQCLINKIAGGKGLRELLDNVVLDLYDGPPPAAPEAARIGDHLARYTLNGGAVAATDINTAQSYLLAIAGGNLSVGKTVKVTVTVDGNGGVTYIYTLVAGDTTEALVNLHVAQMLNQIPEVMAICDPTTPAIWAECRIAGLMGAGVALVIADGGGDKTVTATAKTAAARVNTLQFGPAVAGVISKPTGDTWQCSSNLFTGVAGYFTVCTPDDTGGLDSGYIYKRIQGTIGPVGADSVINPATVTQGAVSNVLTFTLTVPSQ